MSGFESYATTSHDKEIENKVEVIENTSSASMTPTGERLKAYIERVERLEEDKKAIQEDIKELFAELKNDGFDVKTVKKIISLRKKDPSDRAEEETILETYMAAIGME